MNRCKRTAAKRREALRLGLALSGHATSQTHPLAIWASSIRSLALQQQLKPVVTITKVPDASDELVEISHSTDDSSSVPSDSAMPSLTSSDELSDHEDPLVPLAHSPESTELALSEV